MSYTRRIRCWLGVLTVIVGALGGDPSALAQTVTYQYDALGRLQSVSYWEGAKVVYTFDAAGNRIQVVSTPAVVLTQPTQVIATTVSATSLSVSWTAPTGGTPPYSYEVDYGSTVGPTTTGTNAVVTGLSPGTAYTFTVKARDQDGYTTTSNPSAAVSTYPLPVITPFTAQTQSSSQIQLTFTATDTGGPAGALALSVPRFGSVVTACTASPCMDAGLTPGRAYTYTLTVKDSVGDTVTGSASATTYTLPTVSVTATPVSTTQITVTWTASDTGGPGIRNYTVSRSGTQLSCTTSPCADSGLTAATSYTYTVTAFDTANDSGSGSATAVTVPTAPQGLKTSPVGHTIGSGYTVLWTASPGAVAYYALTESDQNSTAVNHYTINAPAVSYAASKPYNTAWSYQVQACTAANACSALSNTVLINVCPPSGCPPP